MRHTTLTRRCSISIRIALISFGGVCLGLSSNEASPNEPTVWAKENSLVPLAGHSEHGAAFNEGPRQDAYIMYGTGKVHFPVTTSNEQAQQFFDQGVGQLHGFWFYEAERSFRRTRQLEPTCAMASWGMAMANLDNAQRARQFIGEAVNKIELQESSTERERFFVDSLAKFLQEDKRDETQRHQDYIKTLEKIIRKFPDDIEAKAFLAVQLWRSSGKGVPINSHVAVDALIGQVLAVQPMHPVHHYRIHLWDHEEPAEALTSAARCGQASPSIAHMWHMPGHIYSRLRRYADAAWQQEASARADHAYMMRDHVLPDQIHNYAHNNEWLIRNLIHLGRWRDAIALAKNMLELPRHPKYNNFGRDQKDSCQYGRQRLMQVLETFELWEETVNLAETMYLEPTNALNERAKRLRLLAIAYHHLGRWSDFEACRLKLDDLVRQVETKVHAASVKEAATVADSAATPPDQQKVESKCVADMSGEERAEKLKKEHAQVLNAQREIAGISLLASGDKDGAAKTFEQWDDLPLLRKARFAFRWGNHELAQTTIANAVKASENEVAPLGVQIGLLRQMGKNEEAKEAFSRLRTVAAYADLNAPLFNHLSQLANSFEWPEDWRLPPTVPRDVGNRPELETLGPFRWSPVPAPDWTLPDAQNHPTQLADYAGRPVVIILYLGYGCLHCAEQLQAFLPRRSEFVNAGVEMVAISTDNVETLAKSIENFSEENRFDIDLVADPDQRVFKTYRCYDDFEQAPLHGTFLIDAQGLIRWHDIGHQPFDNVDFLLGEATRLLSIPVKEN